MGKFTAFLKLLFCGRSGPARDIVQPAAKGDEARLLGTLAPISDVPGAALRHCEPEGPDQPLRREIIDDVGTQSHRHADAVERHRAPVVATSGLG